MKQKELKLLTLWEKICKEKIDETYNEYMTLKQDIVMIKNDR